MNTDIRIKVGFSTHPKTLKLEKLYGPKAVLSLIQLWQWAAQYRPKGSLAHMSNQEIANAAGWPEDRADEFIQGLTEARFLDRSKTLHDWAEHQAFAYHAPERSKSAKLAAATRWQQNNSHATRNAERIPERNAKRNAPSPDPIPSPNPTPNPSPAPRIAQPLATLDAAFKTAIDTHDLNTLTQISPKSDPHALKIALEREQEQQRASMQKPPRINKLP